MKYSAILKSLSALALFSIVTSALSNYDPLDARDWVDDLFTRNEGYPTIEDVATRDNLIASLTTRDLVDELEARLVKRAPNPSPSTSASDSEPTVEIPTLPTVEIPTLKQDPVGPGGDGKPPTRKPSMKHRAKNAAHILAPAANMAAAALVPELPVAKAIVHAAATLPKSQS